MNTPETVNGKRVLKYPMYYEYVGYFCLLVAALGAFLATKADLGFLWITAIFGFAGIFTVLARRNSVVLYDDSRVTARNMFGQERMLYWNQITELRYDAVQGYLKLRGDGKSLSANYVMTGFQEYVGKLRQNLNASLLPELDRLTPKFRVQPHMGISTEPIVASQQGIEEKENAAKLLVGLAFFQFVVGLASFGVGFYYAANADAKNTAMAFSAMFLFSSFIYVISGSLLYAFNSRVVGVIVTLFTVFNLISAFTGGAHVGSLFIYFFILWSCGRATYAIFLIHKNWPDQITHRNKFPKWFMVLYGLMFGSVVIAMVLLVIGWRFLPQATYYTCEDGSGFYARVFNNGNLQIDTDEGATNTYPIDNSTSTTVFIYGDGERGYTFVGPGQIISTKRGDSPTSTICYAMSEKPVWKRYNLPLFSVELPKQPTDANQTGRYAIDRGFSTYHVYTSQNDPNLISIEVGEYLTSVDTFKPDAIFNDSLDTIKSISGVSIATTTRFVLKGNKAMRVEYTDPTNNQSTKAVMVFWASKVENPARFYTISEMTHTGSYDAEDFERLLGTFEFAPANPCYGIPEGQCKE